ncbi:MULTISPECIES: glutaredoxin domain-containing protein [Leucobacter]|uniref:Mycoredoxin n=2 Tax=Leucobacter TaxID=55968 RepID=A0ABP5MZD4_9MICO|nr:MULTISPECIES: glutaredoxin domain-containing protein [Leucobacter]MBS3183354.1 NrdH-redoxin [Leucobacter manosquensis]
MSDAPADHPQSATETVIFGADWCGDCRRAKLIFDRSSAPYRYIDLVQDPAAAEVARDISGRTNIPVILYPDSSHQVEPSNADMLQKIAELRLGQP